MRTQLTFQSMEEWFSSLPKLNRQEIYCLCEGDSKGMGVFEPNPEFVRQWAEHYQPVITLDDFRRIHQGGWYYLSAALAGFRSQYSNFHLGDDGFDPFRHDAYWQHDDQVRSELENERGQKVVLARISRNWSHEPFRVVQVTDVPQGAELFVEARRSFLLKERNSSFCVDLGDSPTDMWVMRAMGFVQTYSHTIPVTVDSRLHRFNAAPTLDWVFVPDERMYRGEVNVMGEVACFLNDHPSKPSFARLKRLVAMATSDSRTYYFKDWR